MPTAPPSTSPPSEGALAYDRGDAQLYAVNAGSGTITTFGVRDDRLQRRRVLPTSGDFPVSTAVHGDLVYVLNAPTAARCRATAGSGPF